MGHAIPNPFLEDKEDGGVSSFSLLDRHQYIGLSELYLFTSASPLFEHEDCPLLQEKVEESIWKRTLPVPTATAERSL